MNVEQPDDRTCPSSPAVKPSLEERAQIAVHKRKRQRFKPPDLDATQPPEPPAHHDTLAGTGMDQDPLS